MPHNAPKIVDAIAHDIYAMLDDYHAFTPLDEIAEGIDASYFAHCPDWEGPISEQFARKLTCAARKIDDYGDTDEAWRNLRNIVWALLPESVWPTQSA